MKKRRATAFDRTANGVDTKAKRHRSRLLRPSSDHVVLTTGSPHGTVAIGPEHGGSTTGDNAKRAHRNSAVVIYWRVNAPLGPDELADHDAFPQPTPGRTDDPRVVNA